MNGWSLSASTLDKDGTTHKDRGGAAWFIGDVSGTDWRFEYDFSGTTNGSTDIVLYLGLDDGDNLATTRVMGFGSTAGPEDGVAVGDAWTIVTAKVAVGSDNSLALPDLTGFDIMVMKIMNGETEGSFDNFELPAGPASLAPNGATVPIGDVDLSWTNMDPNNPGDPVFVDVWFGTEPNELNPNYDMALVISEPFNVDVPLGRDDRFLTLVVTKGERSGSGNTMVIAEPILHIGD